MNSLYKKMNMINDEESLSEKYNVKNAKELKNHRELKKLKESSYNVNSVKELGKLHEARTEKIPFTADELKNYDDEDNYDRIIEWAEQTVFSDVHRRLDDEFDLYSEPSGGYDIVTQRSDVGELKCIIDLSDEYDLLMEDLSDGESYEFIVDHLTDWIADRTFDDGEFEGVDLIFLVDEATEEGESSLTDEERSEIEDMDIDEYIDEYYYPVDLEDLVGFPVTSDPEEYARRAVELFVSYAEKGIGVLLKDDEGWTDKYNFLFVPGKVAQSDSWGDYDSVENAKKYLSTTVQEAFHMNKATKKSRSC